VQGRIEERDVEVPWHEGRSSKSAATRPNAPGSLRA
jgi:hypothetical protein